jgi:hypothetical protein
VPWKLRQKVGAFLQQVSTKRVKMQIGKRIRDNRRIDIAETASDREVLLKEWLRAYQRNI